MSEELIESAVDRDDVLEAVETQTQPTQSLEQKARSSEEQNWKKMREENERYKREAEALKRQIETQRGDDELVEYKQLKQMRQELEQQTLELRIKNKFSDFDEVVNKKALDKLAQEDPELAYAIDATPDMYTKAVAAYKMLKAKHAPQEEQEERFTEEDRSYYENKSKPRSTNSVSPQRGDRPLSQANAFQNGLTKEVKDQLYREMQEARSKL
jgi:hypothetical protein